MSAETDSEREAVEEIEEPTSQEIGEEIERRLCERRESWERLDADEIERGDAIERRSRHLDDREIEIKAARVEMSSGRSGRFYIRQRAHEALTERDGIYALAVYSLDADQEIEIEAVEILPSATLGSLLGSWSRVDRPGEEAVAKIAHSSLRILDPAVWITTGGSAPTLHEAPDCRGLRAAAKEPIPKDPDLYEGRTRAEYCGYCSDR
jgi:hypothetical protein